MFPTISLCQFCETNGPSICFSTQAFPKHDCGSEVEFDSPIPHNVMSNIEPESCQMCTILPGDQKCILTHELSTHRSYVSTASPSILASFQVVRKACLRSLSQEHMINEGMLLFSQDEFAVITYIFQLKDINSRGEMRKFCIVLILGDRLEAVSHMLDAEKAMKDIAKHLTEKATLSYEKDVKNPAMNNSRCHSRVYIPDTNLRSLKQLLEFGDVHNFLHSKFSQLLHTMEHKYSQLRIVPAGKISEMKLSDSYSPCFCEAPSSNSLTRERAETLVETPAPKFLNIHEIHGQLEEDKFRELLCHIVCGNQVVVRGAHALTIESFISIMATVLPHSCVMNKGFCPKYQDIPVNNFIGVPQSEQIPESTQLVIADIATSHRTSSYQQAKPTIYSFHETNGQISQLKSSRDRWESPPNIVREIEMLVAGKRFDNAGDPNNKTHEKSLYAIIQKWAGKAKMYYLYRKTANTEDEIALSSILDIITAEKCDIPVLMFFSGALSKDEKNKLLKEVQ